MAIQEGSKYLHWNYFLALESDTEQLSRYVEFTTDNFSTYSLEMAHLLLAAASEVDVIAKILCKKTDTSQNADSIGKYREILKPSFPNIQNMKVLVPRYGLELCPWFNWSDDENPEWWTAYNKVKHHRSTHYQRANLKNILNAVAGLFVMLLYLYKEDAEAGTLAPSPSLFRVGDEFFAGVDLGSGDVRFVYKL
jgi:hypothetical protein